MGKISPNYVLSSIGEWLLTGDMDKPPPVVKIMAIAYALERSGYHRFIETGTYRGDTTAVIAETGVRIDTIELSSELLEAARQRLAPLPNVTVHEGDSSVVLPQLLRDLDEPAVFWLDAHYSGGATAKGRTETPILSELLSILCHPLKTHVLLIDDTWIFGTGDYPRLDFVIDLVRHYLPMSVMDHRYGVLCVKPVGMAQLPGDFHIPRGILG